MQQTFYEKYIKTLQMQQALLKAQIDEDKSFPMSIEREELLLMLGCVELQIKKTKDRILLENRIEFETENAN